MPPARGLLLLGNPFMAWFEWVRKLLPEPSLEYIAAPHLIADFIRAWEGCSLTPYKDIAGHYTVGIGHLMAANEPLVAITQERADLLFAIDLAHAQADVAQMVRGTQQQIDALTSFVFNFGLPALRNSTLLHLLNEGKVSAAGDEFKRWNHARDPKTGLLVEVEGLTKRRRAERNMFLFGMYDGKP